MPMTSPPVTSVTWVVDHILIFVDHILIFADHILIIYFIISSFLSSNHCYASKEMIIETRSHTGSRGGEGSIDQGSSPPGLHLYPTLKVQLLVNYFCFNIFYSYPIVPFLLYFVEPVPYWSDSFQMDIAYWIRTEWFSNRIVPNRKKIRSGYTRL